MDYLLNISPIDGRYFNTTRCLSDYLSEYALIKYRVLIEIRWLIYLLDKHILNDIIKDNEKKQLLNIYNNFNLEDAKKVKEIEKEIKHDVKAIEYFLRDKFDELKLSRLKPFIHITLTSEDINNVSYNLMIKDTLDNVYLPKLKELLNILDNLSNDYKDTPMLAHTHGQAATPTTVGKEIKVFSYRIKSILNYLNNIKLKSKFSGAVGNYNAHIVAFPNIDWINYKRL